MSHRRDLAQRVSRVNETQIRKCRRRQHVTHLPKKHSQDQQCQRKHAVSGYVKNPSLQLSAKIIHAERAYVVETLAKEVKTNRHFNDVNM